MTTVDNQLFSAEEALSRLGKNKEQGCLIVSKGPEIISIYVQNGLILDAISSQRQGRDAVDLAVHLAESSYHWIRGVKPPSAGSDLKLNIQEFVLAQGNVVKDKATETGKLNLRSDEKVTEGKYNYFLVPDNQPMSKLYLTKTATVLGRDSSSDLVIDDFNVSGRHCILDIQSRGLFVLDLDSTNGSYLNGVMVRDGYVNPGDVIELGSYRLTVNRELRKELRPL